MSEFFFVLKTFAVTVVILALLQIKIGRSTIEQRSMAWMHQSVAIEVLRSVADGAVTVADRSYTYVKSAFNKHVGNPFEGSAEEPKRAVRKKTWEDEVHKAEGEHVD